MAMMSWMRRTSRYFLIAVVVTFIASLAYFGATQDGSAPEWVASVNGETISAAAFQRAYRNTVEQYRQAFQLLEPHEQARAGDPAYDYLLGIAAIDSGELTRGVFALERVLAVNPNHAQARAEIARAYFLMGENKVARQEFEQVKQARPPAVAGSRNVSR